ncbi:toxin glutamine deamidase domain-containing protein [Corynebacterium sp. NML130628]|uniref:toxin glutamine deamidase domain-containing protein n=1 Tax=Corynebacterium sp. NML130628 TaxID=1906333 RepID=UPI00091881E8|nr:toxin glutamine deamidase domain-containing protein [Corynebacterium sp. NML130628]OIR46470.1 hypothetical protein BJP07_00100 [Corynebacterium sp. NML130628]
MSVADLLKREGRVQGPPVQRSKSKVHYERAQQELAKTYTMLPFINTGMPRRYNSLSEVPRMPKSVSMADITATANPWFGKPGYSENCMRVAHTVELRMRGYDITAGSTAYDPPARRSDPAVLAVIKAAKQSNQRLTLGHYGLQSAWRTTDGKVRMPYAAREALGKGGKNAQTIRDMEHFAPDGARGVAMCVWDKANVGHIWNWEKRDGKIHWFEAQTRQGFIDQDLYLSRMVNGSLTMLRTDDLVPTDEILGVIGVD